MMERHRVSPNLDDTLSHKHILRVGSHQIILQVHNGLQKLSGSRSDKKTFSYNAKDAEQTLSRSRSNKPTFLYNAKDIKQILSGSRSNKPTFPNYGKDTEQILSGSRSNKPTFLYNAKDTEQILSGSRSNKPTFLYNAKKNAKDTEQILSRSISNKPTFPNYGKDTEQILSGSRSNKPTQIYNTQGSKLPTGDAVTFFLVKDLAHLGSKMKLDFYMVAKEAKFFPLEVANSIPFSSSKLPEILQLFEVRNPKSTTAKLIEDTITLCEFKPIKGEQKSCATSLEAMVDYAKSRLGNQVNVLSTDIDNETEQEYTIASSKKLKNEKNLVCHKVVYPYAVFYCHALSRTDIYEVSLIDANGKKLRAVAICHNDTSLWYPGHIAFQLLKVKPGSVPICHFLSVDAMLWVPNK